jgi:hypothetical protein
MMRWRRRRAAEETEARHEQELRLESTASERELAIEAVERELHLPVHAQSVHGPSELPVAPELPEPAENNRPAWRSWVRVIILCVVIGGLLGGAVAALLHYADGPSEGFVKAAEEASQPKPTATPSPGALAGLYVGFEYPANFGRIERVASTPPDLENYVLATNSSLATPRVTLAVAVAPAGHGLDDDSGYQMRRLKPSLYAAKPVVMSSGSAVLFTRNDSTEQTLYWTNGKYRLSLAVGQSTGNGSDIEAVMQMVMKTARWRS